MATPTSPSAASDTPASLPVSEVPFAATSQNRSILKSFSPDVLAQALAEQLAITPNNWHQLSSNRAVRAREQTAAALVYMLKDKPEEALPRLAQAIGWLDKTLTAPPCPTHGSHGSKRTGSKRSDSQPTDTKPLNESSH